MSDAYERERQNNSRLDELANKVSALRGVTIDIYDNARDQGVIDSTVRLLPLVFWGQGWGFGRGLGLAVWRRGTFVRAGGAVEDVRDRVMPESAVGKCLERALICVNRARLFPPLARR